MRSTNQKKLRSQSQNLRMKPAILPRRRPGLVFQQTSSNEMRGEQSRFLRKYVVRPTIVLRHSRQYLWDFSQARNTRLHRLDCRLGSIKRSGAECNGLSRC